MNFVGTVEKVGNKYEIIYDLEEKRQIALIKFGIGKRVTANIKKFYKPRTTKQMGYFFGYVLPITTAWMGYFRHERDHVYETLKQEYLKDVDEKGREYLRSLKWDSEDPVDTQLMNWFTDQVRDMVSVRYGYFIKDPDKYNPGDVNEIVTEIERMGG
jgi:hypothetical protein